MHDGFGVRSLLVRGPITVGSDLGFVSEFFQNIESQVGFGRIIASEIEVPNMVYWIWYEVDEQSHKATVRLNPSRRARTASGTLRPGTRTR